MPMAQTTVNASQVSHLGLRRKSHRERGLALDML
jgi:hypothetical protein